MPVPWLGVVLMINSQPPLSFQHLKQWRSSVIGPSKELSHAGFMIKSYLFHVDNKSATLATVEIRAPLNISLPYC